MFSFINISSKSIYPEQDSLSTYFIPKVQLFNSKYIRLSVIMSKSCIYSYPFKLSWFLVPNLLQYVNLFVFQKQFNSQCSLFLSSFNMCSLCSRNSSTLCVPCSYPPSICEPFCVPEIVQLLVFFVPILFQYVFLVFQKQFNSWCSLFQSSFLPQVNYFVFLPYTILILSPRLTTLCSSHILSLFSTLG